MAKGTSAGGRAAGTQAISRTLAVLNLFRESDVVDLGISDITKQLSLNVSTVHRIVRALVDDGYLSQNQNSSRYVLGRSAVLLGQAANRRLGIDLAQAIMKRLGEETGESVNLGVRNGDDMEVVISIESKQLLRFSQSPGNRLPIHATGMGKAVLSHSDSVEDEIADLNKPLQKLTQNTITSVNELRKELNLIRSRGYSIDNREAIEGVRCVAAPILSLDGQVLAALAVQAPTVRMSDAKLKQILPSLCATAKEIAQVLPAAPI